ALAPRELQAIGPAAEVQAQAVPGVPQHRVVAFGSLAKAQAAAAPAGERPAVAAIPRRVRGDTFALLAQQHRDASCGKIERRERGRPPREGGYFPLDEAGVDFVADDLRMAQQRLEEREISGDAGDLKRLQCRR